MNLWQAWREQDLGPVVALFTAAAAYCAYYYGTRAQFLLHRAQRRGDDVADAQLAAWTWQRVGGAFFLGVVPTLVALFALGRDAKTLGLGAAPFGHTLAFAGATYAALAPLLFLTARTPAHQARYPEIRLPVWSPAVVWRNVWTWVLYLVAYELFFRGFVLGTMIDAFGVWPGIAVMTALYVLVHLPKGAGETVGCFLMGIVFSWMTLETGAIWAAVLTHIGIALSSDFFTVRASATMRFSR